MKPSKLLFNFLLVSQLLPVLILAQSSTSKLVQIELTPEKTGLDLIKLGIDITHGDYVPERHFICEFTDEEYQQIQAAGFNTKTLISDMGQWRNEKNENDVTFRDDIACHKIDRPVVYPTPQNFQLGDADYAYYYRYQDILDILDDMRVKFPNLITSKVAIPNATIENRPIYWVKISDNPDLDEPEPEVFYNAATHPREVMSVITLIHYMWYVLENYTSDTEVNWLVNNTEMYFMPCANPDGYIHNETLAPNGGGLWRKNRRDNLDGSFGVDLNRNFDFEWGVGPHNSDQGSSEAYRGTAPFSEPETQAIRDFCNAHEFTVALNHHSFQDVLIYPFGHDLSVSPPEESAFQGMGHLMTRENNYKFGNLPEVLFLIQTGGGAPDWMYGETVSKPKTYAFVPEIGHPSSGFWPPLENIHTDCQATVGMNLSAARIPHVTGTASDLTPDIVTNLSNNLEFVVQRAGLTDGTLEVSLTPISNVQSVGSPQTFDLSLGEKAISDISYTLPPSIQPGTEFILELNIDNGTRIYREKLFKIFASPVSVFADDCSNLNQWNSSGNWGVSNSTFVSSPSSITESPNGNYSSNLSTEINVINNVNVLYPNHTILTFLAKWDIESNYDYAQVYLRFMNGQNTVTIPLCGRHTELGEIEGDNQPAEPLYDGLQENWILEEIDLGPYLEDYTASSFTIGFKFDSDHSVEHDGFYFDDVEVISLDHALYIKDIDFTATLTAQQTVELKWQNPDIENLEIDIQHSADGGNFSVIKKLRNLKAGESHSYIDTKPIKGHNYYRLTWVNEQAEQQFSPIRLVEKSAGWEVFLDDFNQQLSMSGIEAGTENLEINLFTIEGRLLQTTRLTKVQTEEINIDLPFKTTNSPQIIIAAITTAYQKQVQRLLWK